MKKAFLLALTVSLFAGHVPASLAQEAYGLGGSRKPACGCYICGTLDYVSFKDQDCAGILAEDACGEAMANIPKEERAGICQRIKTKRKFSSFKSSCPSFASYCESEENASEPPSQKPQDPPSQGAAYPPADPEEDGLGQGFGGPPIPPTGPAPKRLVYLVPGSPGGDEPGSAYTVWLDRFSCAVPLAQNNQPLDPTRAKYVVQGRVVRSKNQVRIEAEARELANDSKLGKVTGEAPGEDASAVATATRSAAQKLKLPCTR